MRALIITGLVVGPLQAQADPTDTVVEAAAETATEAATEAATPADTVELVDGTTLAGDLLENKPGSHVIIELDDGTRRTIAWSQVKGVSESTIDAKKKELRYKSEVDCTEDPSQERCRETTEAHAGAKGVGVSYSKETLSKVKAPPSFDASGTINVGINYGTSTNDDADFTVFGGNFAAGWKLVFGQLPGVEGGVFHGVGGELGIGFNASNFSGAAEGSLAAGRAGGSLGYQYFSFENMNPETLEQPGFGFYAGWQVGGQVTTLEDEDGDEIASDGNLAHGPTINLSWPTYNGGTADLTRWSVDAVGLVTGDFLFINAGLGYVF